MPLEHLSSCPVCQHANLADFLTCTDHTATQENFHLQQCSHCKLVITNPRPFAIELGRYYESSQYISHTGKSSGPIGFLYLLARKFTLQWKVKTIRKFKNPNTILDYGCGTGDLLHQYQKQGWTITGMEPTPAPREKAAQITGTNIAESLLSLKDKKFDVITLWHVLEHIPDLTKTVDELTALLNHSGILLIAVPNYESQDAHYYKQSWAAFDVPRHLWHFNQQSMQHLLRQAGLTLLDTRPMKLDAYYVSLLSQQYQSPRSSYTWNFLNGLIQGLVSNRRARFNNNYSSLIYIAKK